MSAAPWLTWFCVWQAERVLPVAEAEAHALRALLARCPGLRAGHVLLPAQAHDPHYPAPQGSPSLVVQAYFDDLPALENALLPAGALAPLAEAALLPSLADARAAQQAMLVRRHAVPDATLRSATPLTYWVEYEGPAADANAWHLHYNTGHPRLLTQLPGVRAVEVYSPASIVCGLPLPERRCLQRNKVVFDDAPAMNAAMQSPVRAALREDFHRLPPFEGASHHFPFHTHVIEPTRTP